MARPGEERRERRRVGALLGAYYRIEDSDAAPGGEVSAASAAGELDARGFNAQQYFDTMVASGKMPELVKRAKHLDVQIKQLDGQMQSFVYDNYTNLTRAVDVIKQMKFCIEGLDPDLVDLEQAIGRVTSVEQHVEDGVSGRSMQIEVLLKRQRVCRQLQVLFALPSTLSRCLNRGEYGRALEAYCCCLDFLRQYKHMPTFKNVLEDVEHQMNQIGSALEHRLRAPYLSVDEAVNSSVTLLDMGKDHTKVLREYLAGRTAVLKQSLKHCFCGEPLHAPGFGRVDSVANGAEMSKEEQDMRRPESQELQSACWRLTDSYVPQLCDAVEGCQRLQEASEGSVADVLLQDFVSQRVQELCDRLFGLISDRRPPVRVLVSCVHSVRDALRRAHAAMPEPVSKTFMAFLALTADAALRWTFADASSRLVSALSALHADCKRLQESASSGLDDVLEQIAMAEQALLKQSFGALLDSQPLLKLLGPDRPACQRLFAEVQRQELAFFWAFAEVCFRYIGQDPMELRMLEASLDDVPRAAMEELNAVDALEWNGLFGLALVRIGRHLETRVISKVWAVARDLVAEHLGGAQPDGVVSAASAASRATRGAGQIVLTHYVVVSGQRLASFFRNSIQNKNWMTVREPRCPSVLVETVILKEVVAFDAQLARILGDPRKLRASDRRQPLSRFKDSMELEIERLVAKKLRVFAPIPFNRNGAVVGILRIAFKALFEYMREETFAKFGVQQIQVDCAFLADIVRDFAEAEDASALDSLLEEAVTSASQRCEGPVLLEQHAVARLVAESRREARGGGPASPEVT